MCVCVCVFADYENDDASGAGHDDHLSSASHTNLLQNIPYINVYSRLILTFPSLRDSKFVTAKATK